MFSTFGYNIIDMLKNAFCGSSDVVKNGLRGRKQMYKCKSCGRKFTGGRRRSKSQVITEYVDGKQTLRQLSERHGVSIRTIQRDISSMRYVQKVSKEKHVVIQMDTTYWGRGFGLMVIKDAYRNKILWRKYVRSETVADYIEGVRWLEDIGFRIYGIVCDGMRGLVNALRQYPVQMCQFHQIMAVRRYLAEDPELEASSELLRITKQIAHTDKENFIGMLEQWYDEYKNVLDERVHDKRRKRPPFMRPRLRCAYLSLKRNMRWLWTFYDNRDSILIPNTNNGLECIFSDIKSKVRVHSGMKRKNRKRLIVEYIMRHY